MMFEKLSLYCHCLAVIVAWSLLPFEASVSISRDWNYMANVREDEAGARFGEGATLKIP